MINAIIVQLVACAMAFFAGWTIRDYIAWRKELDGIMDRSKAILERLKALGAIDSSGEASEKE